jgi:hypothetical protein
MDDGVRVLLEMNEANWSRFERDVADLTPAEAAWRPLPESNTIALILEHLGIDAAWHVARLERQPVPSSDASPPTPPRGWEESLTTLRSLAERMRAAFAALTMADLQRLTLGAYSDYPAGSVPRHFIGYHFALHLAGHGAQIRTLRNLYCTVRGQPARFFPENPTFPRNEAG